MKIFKKIRSKNNREVSIIEPTMDLLDELIQFFHRLTEEDALINRYEDLAYEVEKRKLENKIEEIKHGDAFACWAVYKGKVVGICGTTRVGGRSKHVGNLGVMVDRDFRHEGIGRALMESVLENAKKLKLKIITLDSFENNEPAMALYEKLGFQVYGRLPKGLLWQNNFYDEIRMYKNL